MRVDAVRHALRVLSVASVLAAAPSVDLGGQAPSVPEPLRRTVTFRGAEREYFLHLPRRLDPGKTYWSLVVVHGGGGNGRQEFPNEKIARMAGESDLDAIVISPSFSNDDINANRFPSLGEGEFLDEVLNDVRKHYAMRPKMLLTGYSRGAQFAHRYALAHPDRVAAVAPLASGTWTTPDGRLLVEEIGEVRNAREFLRDTTNASRVPARLRDLFSARIAAVAESRAAPGAREIPFLVMCGTLDPRLTIAQEFARSLQSLGYQVAVDWPRTPHGCSAECRAENRAEWDRYIRRTVDFFQEFARR